MPTIVASRAYFQMPQRTSTFGLLERFRRGDQDAFTRLFQKYRRRLAVLIHYRLSEAMRSRVDVDDVLQEVFFAAARDMNHFEYRAPGSFQKWLVRIAEHVIVDAVRFESRGKRRASALTRLRSKSNPGGPEPLDWTTPSRVLYRKEAFAQMVGLLDRLRPSYRQVILLTRMEGLSTAEAAERMGKSREAAALLLHRALRRLRQLQAECETS